MLSNELPELLSPRQAPCLSLYQPTHRHHPDNQQDPIRFRNLVKQLEGSLRQQRSAEEVDQLLQPFQALAGDEAFWNHTQEGLAVLAAPGVFRVLRLPRPVAELAVVADSFHVKPLWRFLQTVDRYQVLGLTLNRVRLFEGNRDALEEIEGIEGVPRTIAEALGSELTEPHQTVSSYGGVGAGSAAMRHGHGGRKDELDNDAERFFRAVDRAVHERWSQPSGLPLLLAALPEHQSLFHRVSHNPALLPESISISAETASLEELQALAWQTIQPQVEARLQALIEQFAAARARGLGSDDLAQVAEAAVAGRVATLLIEADRHIPGHLDDASGRVEAGDLAHPGIDDVLDDLGELVARRGGQVVVVPAERMPEKAGVAAIYRY